MSVVFGVVALSAVRLAWPGWRRRKGLPYAVQVLLALLGSAVFGFGVLWLAVSAAKVPTAKPWPDDTISLSFYAGTMITVLVARAVTRIRRAA